MTGPTDRVVVVGAGLGGLACALHLAGAGRQVTVLERASEPGGRAGRLCDAGYQFDTGPTVLTMPELIGEALAAVGESLDDWLDLTGLDPAYRAHYPDGSTLDVITEPIRMADEISRVCGAREADGYRRFVRYARELWRLERADFIQRNLDSPRDLLTGNLLRLLAMGGFGRLQSRIDRFFRDPRTRRVFSFQAMYAGLAPHRALALYAVIAYLDAVAGVYYPRGGIHAVPRALAGAARKHGVRIRYDTVVHRVTTAHGRATGVLTADQELVPADVVVLNPDLPVAYRDLLPGPAPARRMRYSPSCVVLHLGSSAHYSKIAHHNIHFGRAWRATFDEVIRDGRVMTDPSLLVSNPSRTDPGAAPPGRHSYYVLAPAPHLRGADPGPTHRARRSWGPARHLTRPLRGRVTLGRAGRGRNPRHPNSGRLDPGRVDLGRPDVDWRGAFAGRYADSLLHTLEERGYVGIADSIEVRHIATPATWQDAGMAAGTPFAAAHTLRQTGPFRPGNLHPALDNVVFVGSGTQPGVGVPMVLISGKLAAGRVTGR